MQDEACCNHRASCNARIDDGEVAPLVKEHEILLIVRRRSRCLRLHRYIVIISCGLHLLHLLRRHASGHDADAQDEDDADGEQAE